MYNCTLVICFSYLISDMDRERPKFPGLMPGPSSSMMTSLGGSINPSSLFMQPASSLGSHLQHLGSSPFNSNNHLHHNSGGSSSGGSRSAESSPTAASGNIIQKQKTVKR